MTFPDIKSSLSKYKFYIIIGALALGEVMFTVLVLPSQYQSIGENKAKLDTVNADIDKLNSSIESLSQLDSTTLHSYLDKASAALPDQKKTSGLITGLSKLASASGMVMDSLDFSPGLISTESGQPSASAPSPVIQGGGIQTISAAMTVTGDIPSLIAFLRHLDKSSQLLGVSHIKYTGASSAGSQTEVQFYIYYQPPQNIVDLWKDPVSFTDADKEVLTGLSGQDIFNLQ